VSHLSLRIFLRKALSLIKAANAPGTSSSVAESNKNEAIAALQQLEPCEFGVQVMSEGSLTSVEARQNLSRVVLAEIADIFGHPPVLSTENRQAYDALMTQLVLEWKPRSIIGWTFVDDLANISLEIFRHRRAIANLFAISFKTALRAVLTDVLPEEGCKPWFDHYDTVKGLAQAWFEGPQEQEKVKSELAKYGLTAEAIVAQTYVLRRDELHELHRLLAVAEARRIGTIRSFNEYLAMSSLGQKPVVEAK
jgi:hypothetical protein